MCIRDREYAEARKNLAKVDWAVDYVITHCAPTSIALMENRHNEADPLTDFLQEVKERAHYHYWLFGHYHDNRAIDEKHIPVSYTHLHETVKNESCGAV